MIKKSSKIFVAGHNGLVGDSVKRLLIKLKYKNVITINRNKLDLTNSKKIDIFFKKKRPEFLIMCAARVGGILENKSYPLEFLMDNLSIQNNLLLAAKKYKIKRTVFMGSSCIYPKFSKVPIKEEYFMDGKLEKTNEAYAISKIAGIKLSEILYKEYVNDIVCLMPTNVYGINDNFKISSSHVIPGLITKFINSTYRYSYHNKKYYFTSLKLGHKLIPASFLGHNYSSEFNFCHSYNFKSLVFFCLILKSSLRHDIY